MASEYRKEQLIEQYEHITKLQLLSDEELSHIKRKRSYFEASIHKATEIKPFIDYIKFEIALMKKFKQMKFKSERDSRALDTAISSHVRDIFRMALKKFQDKRKIWEHYIAFCKQKFPNTVTRLYESMLCFHRKTEDFIEAAEHETSKRNYTTALNFLLQGMANNKDSCEQLVVAYIHCSLKQGNEEGEETKAAVLLQASKFYLKFLKDSTDVSMHCELLKKIQSFQYSIGFQNDIITILMREFADRPEVWNLLAKRHLEGVFYESPTEEKKEADDKKVPFEACLSHVITIYEKSLDSVGALHKQQMLTLYIAELLELESKSSIKGSSMKLVRHSLGKSLSRGYNEDILSVDHYILFLKLRMVNLEKNKKDIEEMLETGARLYPTSLEIFELSIRYFIETKNHDQITKTFNFAIENNKKNAIELYQFMCEVYLNTEEKEKARAAMLQAVNSGNKKLSESFQSYYIEYHSMTEGIDKAREVFNQLLTSKTLNSLSLEFFKAMIKVEEAEEVPNEKNIMNCYERATEHFGKESHEVSELKRFLKESL